MSSLSHEDPYYIKATPHTIFQHHCCCSSARRDWQRRDTHHWPAKINRVCRYDHRR